jgi:hypothetical protein
MNRKTINSVLTKKINNWANSIDDDVVRAAVLRDTIVTGGSIASMLLNEEVKDFDVYFKTKDTVRKVSEYYVKKFNEHPTRTASAEVLCSENLYEKTNELEKLSFKSEEDLTKGEKFRKVQLEKALYKLGDRVKIFVSSKGVAALNKEILENPFEDAVEEVEEVSNPERAQKAKLKPYSPVFLSTNAITLTDKIQLVIRFYGEVEEIHKNFDFVHATNCWESNGNKLTLKQEALECLLNKELKYQGSKYPLCSFIRTRKFIKRGFHINAGQYLKMAMNLQEFDLQDVDVLEDQCVGADSAYFNAIIEGLRGQAKGNSNYKVDNSYLATIIDKVFH